MSSNSLMFTPDPVYYGQMSPLVKYKWVSPPAARGPQCPFFYQTGKQLYLLYLERFFTDIDRFARTLQERRFYCLGSFSTLVYTVRSQQFIFHATEEANGQFTYYYCQLFNLDNKLFMECQKIQVGQRSRPMCVSDIQLQYHMMDE